MSRMSNWSTDQLVWSSLILSSYVLFYASGAGFGVGLWIWGLGPWGGGFREWEHVLGVHRRATGGAIVLAIAVSRPFARPRSQPHMFPVDRYKYIYI
eukprot:5582123-Amphidinium_carterae.1